MILWREDEQKQAFPKSLLLSPKEEIRLRLRNNSFWFHQS